jgi:hypothetical protein
VLAGDVPLDGRKLFFGLLQIVLQPS